MLSGQRHAPHRPLKQLVRTDNMGAGIHWLGGRVWVGERAGRKDGGGGWRGGQRKQAREEGTRKSLRGGRAAEEGREGERAREQGWSHVTHAAR